MPNKTYQGDLTLTGQTVELSLQDLPEIGEAGSGAVIAPFAFARIDTTSNGSGTGISWSNWDATNGTLDITFDTAQANTNYTVVTDGEANDDARLVSVQSKTTSGFQISVYDSNGNAVTPSAANSFAIIVYGETPTIEVQAGNDVIIKSIQNAYVPTTEQIMSSSVWTDIDGSDVSFTPLSLNSDILYRYEFPAASANTGEFDLSLRLLVDGIEQDDSFEYNYDQGGGGQKISYSHIIPSWGIGTSYVVKLQGKVNESYRSAIVHPEMPIGETPSSFRQARLVITEYA